MGKIRSDESKNSSLGKPLLALQANTTTKKINYFPKRDQLDENTAREDPNVFNVLNKPLKLKNTQSNPNRIGKQLSSKNLSIIEKGRKMNSRKGRTRKFCRLSKKEYCHIANSAIDRYRARRATIEDSRCSSRKVDSFLGPSTNRFLENTASPLESSRKRSFDKLEEILTIGHQKEGSGGENGEPVVNKKLSSELELTDQNDEVETIINEVNESSQVMIKELSNIDKLSLANTSKDLNFQIGLKSSLLVFIFVIFLKLD